MNSCMGTHTHTHLRTQHTHIRTHHTHRHIYVQTTHVHTTHTHIRTHHATHTHTHTLAHTHTHTLAHTHTHWHTHTNQCSTLGSGNIYGSGTLVSIRLQTLFRGALETRTTAKLSRACFVMAAAISAGGPLHPHNLVTTSGQVPYDPCPRTVPCLKDSAPAIFEFRHSAVYLASFPGFPLAFISPSLR